MLRATRCSSTSNSSNGYVYWFTIEGLAPFEKVGTEYIPWTYTLQENSCTGVNTFYTISYQRSNTDHAAAGEYIINMEENSYAMPSTGGPGTSLFYILGSLMTLVAAVLLITKKRSDGAGI